MAATPLQRERAKLVRQQEALDATQQELNNLAQAPDQRPFATIIAQLRTKEKRQRNIIDGTIQYIQFLEQNEQDPNQLQLDTKASKKAK